MNIEHQLPDLSTPDSLDYQILKFSLYLVHPPPIGIADLYSISHLMEVHCVNKSLYFSHTCLMQINDYMIVTILPPSFKYCTSAQQHY